jgi:exopolysaccharide biosynthesis polyprenyl glycosylphosphotransferase
MANAALGYQIIGFVDDDVSKSRTDIGRFEALGNLQNLPKLLDEKHIDEVIITLPWRYQRKIMSITTMCHHKNIRSRVVPGMFQMALGRMEITEMAGIPLLGMRQTAISGMNIIIKRVVDFSLALISLIFLSPLMALIALAIKMDSAGPAIFSQERLGRNMKPFRVYKFRSMVVDAEAQKPALEAFNEAEGPLFKIKDDPRRTRVGRVLRKFSLDELPQFYNVLKGDMSLVGPRPNLPAEVADYKEWHKRRLEVMPGLTGLWAIHGRSELPFDEVVLLDLYYIENWSLLLDIKIMLQTIPRVLLGHGSY